MKSKRIFSLIIVAALICAFAVGVAACGGDKPSISFDDDFSGASSDDYEFDSDLLGISEGDAVDNMSAYDLIMAAYSNWCGDDGYVRRERFVFTADLYGKINVATRSTDLLRKVDGESIYSQEVILGTGQDKGTKAIRYYFDGENAWDSENTDKACISEGDSGVPTTTDWGGYRPYAGDVAEQNRVLTEHLTTYDFSKRDYLSDKHNDAVYMVDNVYYCTMTIDCSIEMMDTVHRAAKDEFLANTGAKDEGFSIEDTTIDFAIAMIDGKYKFVAWKRNENYSGKHSSFSAEVVCSQTCYSTYSYEGYEITEELPV